jgi:glucose/arabinose dehydrogenase
VIWRQVPKVTGRGHYSHRIAFAPDGQYLFLSSGERQKFDPAQDLGVNLGKIIRLLPDGSPAPGNRSPTVVAFPRRWSYGHRNVLGLKFDAQGRLWDLEHGPAGGDELNLLEPGKNYGWPLVSDGDNYDGTPIPRNATRPDLAAPAISWNPVIAPGDFVFYSGKAFRNGAARR